MSNPLTKKKKTGAFSDEELGAMKARVKELKAGKGASEEEVLAKLAEMSPADRALGERLHAVITSAAPKLSPRLWYGMPAYYNEGKLICHFQSSAKFKTRYATLGFSDAAALDDGTMWPVAYALPQKLAAADEARIRALVKKAVG